MSVKEGRKQGRGMGNKILNIFYAGINIFKQNWEMKIISTHGHGYNSVDLGLVVQA